MKSVYLSLLFLIFTTISNAQIKDLFNKAKNTVSTINKNDGDIGAGLKEALNNGIESAVNQLSAGKGYLDSPYKILIPADAQKVIDKVKKIQGMDITFVTTAKTDKEAKALLTHFGLPFKKNK